MKKKEKNPVIEYMKQLISFRNNGLRSPEGWKYSCIEEFILENGREFNKKVNFWEDLMPARECFKNALDLVSEYKDLIYVEGFAQTGVPIPLLHAWVCTKEGKVIDPTWAKGEFYYGVPFKTEYVLKTIIKREKYGVLDNWEKGFPLLKKGIKSDFLVKI